MSEGNKFVSWVKAHKTELIIAGVTVVGMVLAVKNLDSIKGLFKVTRSAVSNTVKIDPVAEEIVVPIISSNTLDNLTGNKLTARALGDKVWCSAQAINKRIVVAGLAVKLPCGEYMMTDVGRILGKIHGKPRLQVIPFPISNGMKKSSK